VADPISNSFAGLPEIIRSFIAVPIPDEVLAQLSGIQQQLKRKFQKVSWTRPTAMHLTLQFLGDIKSTRLPELMSVMSDATRELSAFDVELSGVGSFGNRVLWVGVKRGVEPLTFLANALRRATKGFGDHDEERAFSAHVTLGRCRTPARDAGKILSEVTVPRLTPWRVDDCELIRSEPSPQGSRYTTLARFPLRAD